MNRKERIAFSVTSEEKQLVIEYTKSIGSTPSGFSRILVLREIKQLLNASKPNNIFDKEAFEELKQMILDPEVLKKKK